MQQWLSIVNDEFTGAAQSMGTKRACERLRKLSLHNCSATYTFQT